MCDEAMQAPNHLMFTEPPDTEESTDACCVTSMPASAETKCYDTQSNPCPKTSNQGVIE